MIQTTVLDNWTAEELACFWEQIQFHPAMRRDREEGHFNLVQLERYTVLAITGGYQDDGLLSRGVT